MSGNSCDSVLFPLTANPIGLHHLLIANQALKQLGHSGQVIFIISNGLHPDPSKKQSIASCEKRLEWLQKSLEAHHELQHRFDNFQLSLKNTKIDKSEFYENRPVFLQEHIERYSQANQKIKVLIGSDLLKRMQKCQIFLQQNLEVMQSQAEFWIVSRGQDNIAGQMEELERQRHVKFSWQELCFNNFPNGLSGVLQLSSTTIRQLAVEGVSLKMCLPASIVQSVAQQSHVWQEDVLYQLKQGYDALQQQIDENVKTTQDLFKHLKNDEQGHTLATVETSTGGKLADAFCKPYGMSNYFLEGQVLYSKGSQQQFLHDQNLSQIVSEQHVLKLARRLKEQTRASYVIAEAGMAGSPDGTRQSLKNGQVALALISEKKEQTLLVQNPVFLTKEEHRLRFALEATKEFLKMIVA